MMVEVLVAISLAATPVHDIYTNWKMPGTNTSCCGEYDCYPTQAVFKDGAWWALRREDQKWLRVPESSIINETPADGKAHLCAPPPAKDNAGRTMEDIDLIDIWCFNPPESGS